MKEEDKDKKKAIIAIVLMIIILILIIFNAVQNSISQNNVTNTIPQNEIDNGADINPNLSTNLDELIETTEYERIQQYLDKYLFYIEEQDYETAYGLLYDEFKARYYPTIDIYTQYVMNKYPVVTAISFEGYDKLGKYNVLTIKVSDILNATETTTPSFEQKFIIMENGLNDFKISFQAE